MSIPTLTPAPSIDSDLAGYSPASQSRSCSSWASPPLPRWARWAWSRLKGGLDTSRYTTAMSVLHDCRPVATLCPAWPTPPPPGKRYMSAGIGNGTADLLLGPGLGMAQCVHIRLRYEDGTDVTQFSYKKLRHRYKRCAIQLRSGHNCATPQLRNRHESGTRPCHWAFSRLAGGEHETPQAYTGRK